MSSYATDKRTQSVSRAESIRRQLDLMAEVRDRVATEPWKDSEAWMYALVNLTDSLISQLHTAECEAAGVLENPWHRLHGADVDWSEL